MLLNSFREQILSLEDREIGKSIHRQSRLEWRIISINGNGCKRRFQHSIYENGREREETIRAFTNEGTFGESSAGPMHNIRLDLC
jgi:hypothetical protein